MKNKIKPRDPRIFFFFLAISVESSGIPKFPKRQFGVMVNTLLGGSSSSSEVLR